MEKKLETKSGYSVGGPACQNEKMARDGTKKSQILARNRNLIFFLFFQSCRGIRALESQRQRKERLRKKINANRNVGMRLVLSNSALFEPDRQPTDRSNARFVLKCSSTIIVERKTFEHILSSDIVTTNM